MTENTHIASTEHSTAMHLQTQVYMVKAYSGSNMSAAAGLAQGFVR